MYLCVLIRLRYEVSSAFFNQADWRFHTKKNIQMPLEPVELHQANFRNLTLGSRLGSRPEVLLPLNCSTATSIEGLLLLP